MPAEEIQSWMQVRRKKKTMANVDVVNLNGEKVGSLELADAVFGQVNEALLWEAVKHYRASLRQGTHATKNRKLVAGSGKKLWKQKGTGRARVGSVRSPLWRHGGHGARTAAAQLRLCVPAQEAAGRAALGAGFEAGRRQAHGGGLAGDQGSARPSSIAQALDKLARDAHGAAGRERQDARRRA